MSTLEWRGENHASPVSAPIVSLAVQASVLSSIQSRQLDLVVAAAVAVGFHIADMALRRDGNCVELVHGPGCEALAVQATIWHQNDVTVRTTISRVDVADALALVGPRGAG